MELQEIFDKVAAHLLKQGEQSVDARGDCVYRGLNGLQCAAGCIIPDDVYHPSMEHKPFEDIAKEFTSIADLFDSRAVLLIQDLQEIHDCWDIDAWGVALSKLAKRYGLKFTQ